MPEPPKGYRFTTHQDDIPKLLRQGKLSQLCFCGHTLAQHKASFIESPCLHCTCKRFAWSSYVVKDPQPTPKHLH